jgi:demethylmenaquinone methyltransferase / 2-methoxy-6-polyprenyl-1,4-benzoquinol methylase
MAKSVTPYKDSDLSKKEQVAAMFDNISGNYDGLNRVISFGIDNKWRKKAIRMIAEKNPRLVLDIATGTGDMAIMLAEASQAKITGVDISGGMLDVGKHKIEGKKLDSRIEMLLADSENLPFADNSYDAVMVSFGIRNFEDLEKGLTEILRVLKPGGRFVILETSVPEKTPFRQGYSFYSRYILPVIGRIFSKDNAAYGYLSASASVFPYGEKLNNILRKIGFIDVVSMPQTFGVATLYSASKSA